MKKKNEKWRLCIDFINLNEACPKDNYSLLRNDQLVEATTGHELLSFMDAYSILAIIRSRCTHKMKTEPPSLLVGESIVTR